MSEKTIEVSLATLATTVAVSVLLSSAVTYGLIRSMTVKPHDVPQIRVVDLMALSMEAAERYQSEAEGDAALKEVFETLKGMQSEGVVLFNSAQVMSVPQEWVLDPKTLLPPAKDQP